MSEIEFLPTASESSAAPTVDVATAAPHGVPCEACGAPVEPLDKFCPTCGCPNAAAATTPEVPSKRDQKFFRCETCGAELAMDKDQRSYTCPFCDSTYVVEFSPEQSQRQEPEFVIGFAVTPEQAREKFQQWVRHNSWFHPGDLATAMIAEKQRGVYLPFWSFSMLAQSRWSARIGEYWYRTETYTTTNAKGETVTRTRQVRETEWWPLSGKHHHYHSGFLVSGSKGLPQADAEAIKPFQLPALKRYEPFYLAGWLCEEYSIDKETALGICQDEFRRREQSHVAAFLPGDTHGDLRVATDFLHVNSDLCLLPVYILSYRYRDNVYRYLVNGQTGKSHGVKPVSWKRVGGWIGAGIAVLLAIFALFMLIGWLLNG